MKMILDYYGCNMSIDEIMTGKVGKTFENYMAEFGLETVYFNPWNILHTSAVSPLPEEGVTMTKNFLVEEINLNRPVYVAWANPLHNVLAVGYEDYGNIIVYHDGNGDPLGAYNKQSLYDFVVSRMLIDCRSVYRS